jgi:hypothetical protein
MPKQRVMVGWTDGGHVDGKFAKALLDLQRYELLVPSPDYEVVDFNHTQSIYITENRNNLVKMAQTVKADWLFQLDGDESFQPDVLRTLMQTAHPVEKPLVVGLYSNIANFHEVGHGSFDVVDMIFCEVGNGAYRNVRPPDDMRPFQVDAAGTGIMLAHMSVFEKIGYPWFHLYYIEVENAPEKMQFMNEDIAFCRVAREAGFPIWCNPMAEATHWKTVPLLPSTLRHFMNKVRKAELEHVGQTDLDSQPARAKSSSGQRTVLVGE